MQNSIFTKIVRGEIPCHKIYEDNKVLAFLDLNPLLPGHTLVIPKRQVDYFDELPDELYQAVSLAAKRVSLRLREVMQTTRTIQLVMGYDVPHAHLHLIPCNRGHDFYQAAGERAKGNLSPEPDHAALTELAAKLAF